MTSTNPYVHDCILLQAHAHAVDSVYVCVTGSITQIFIILKNILYCSFFIIIIIRLKLIVVLTQRQI